MSTDLREMFKSSFQKDALAEPRDACHFLSRIVPESVDSTDGRPISV